MTPSHPGPRIFLSYGHDEYAELAIRLKRDLAARGYEVWFDLHELTPGKDWESYIESGLSWFGASTSQGHSCPKQVLSASFSQPNPLICSGAGGHRKTRSMTARVSCPGRGLARTRRSRDTQLAQTWRPTAFPQLFTQGREAPTVRSLSKTRLAKSCFGQD